MRRIELRNFLDADRVLASFGLERRRTTGRRALAVLSGVGIGALLGAGVVLAARSQRVQAVVGQARRRLPRSEPSTPPAQRPDPDPEARATA